MIRLASGVFLGWSLGANDASNLFGPAVSSRMLRFWTAAILASVFVILGALMEGRAGIETLAALTPMNRETAFLASLAAAITVFLMTAADQPVSASQAVVGAIMGAGLFLRHHIRTGDLTTIGLCWVGTPVGAIFIAVLLHRALARIYNWLPFNLFQMDYLVRWGLVVAGCYAAYCLGANNVANISAVFVASGQLGIGEATLLGGASIALGIITYSRGVMETVGRKLVHLDPFSALVVILAEALTVHIYTFIGVPVSTSQAIVGAVLGVGLVKGAATIKHIVLLRILTAWLLTPALACLAFAALYFLAHLKYVP